MLTIFKTASDIEQKNGIFLKKKRQNLIIPLFKPFFKRFLLQNLLHTFHGRGQKSKTVFVQIWV